MSEPKHCLSCGMALEASQPRPAADFCPYCVDESGQVKARDEVQAGIAMWLRSWSPEMDDTTASERARHYMLAMPHWAV